MAHLHFMKHLGSVAFAAGLLSFSLALTAEPAPALGQDRSAAAPEAEEKRSGGPPNSGSAAEGAPGAQMSKPLPAPDSPEAAREVAMLALYNALASARSTQQATQIAAAIERMWLDAGSDTISVLMERALQSANAGNTGLSLQLLNAVVDLVPDYAEGWNRRAYVLFLANQPVRALGDLRRALALEPKHFRALDGMAKILISQGEKKAALMALEKLREINPKAENLEQSIEDLKREVEGQGI